MIKIVLATNNSHKVTEFKNYFAEQGIEAEIIPISQTGFKGDIIEDADTFEGNAYIKAKALCDFSGLISIADDSGLQVDALNGAPGVYSARFAGENASDWDNIQKLLHCLKDVPEKERTARFVCSICVCRPDGQSLTVSASCEDGLIIDECRGDGKFGYDPIFYFTPMGKTFAEMTSEEKNSVSHRGKAIEKLLKNKDFLEV